jgi:hypothetical protein
LLLQPAADRQEWVRIAQANAESYAVGLRFFTLKEVLLLESDGVVEHCAYLMDKSKIEGVFPLNSRAYDKNTEVAFFIEVAVLGRPGMFASVAFTLATDAAKSRELDVFPVEAATPPKYLHYTPLTIE